MNKRVLGLLLAVFMVSGMVLSPLSAPVVNAAETTEVGTEETGTYDNFKYKVLEDGTVEITGLVETEGVTEVKIPSEIDGKVVASIGDNAFERNSNIISVVIPDSVTSIGGWVFRDCSNLTDISIPDSVASIGARAFDGTQWLKNKQEESDWVVVNDILIFAQTLEGDVEIPNTITGIEGAAFAGATAITSIKIPDSVTSIGDYAFSQCTNLVSVEMPNTITKIGKQAFELCRSLTSVDIPDLVTDIPEYTFMGCDNLTSITIPASMNTIEPWNFNGNEKLKDVYYEGSKSQWNEKKIVDGYANYGLNSAVIHCIDGIYDFEWNVLEDNTVEISGYREKASELTACVIPSEIDDKIVTSIGDEAFGGTENRWQIIEIPNTVTNIGERAFDECTGLQSIEIPDSVTNIGAYAFFQCSSLQSIKIPNAVTNIGKAAFAACSSLTDVYYEGTEAQWQAIAIEGMNEELFNATIHFASATTPDNTNPGTNTNNPTGNSTTTALGKVSVSTSEVTYNGKAQTPAVTVTDANGQLVDAVNYTIAYSENQNVGQATVSITGKNTYTGTVTATFNILPKGTTISKVTAKKKAIAVKWKKQAKQTTGYEIQYSTSKNFKGAKTATVKKNKTTATTIKKLKAKKKYYVRIRTYKTVKMDGKSAKLYSDWSKASTVKVK